MRVKICCISSIEEARLAITYGASAIGLVSDMPSGPGVISEKLIEEIAGIVPPGIATFLLTSKTEANSIIAQQRKCKTNTIQIVDSIKNDAYGKLRDELPGVKIVQVVHVSGGESVDEAKEVSRFVDAILLDSGNQKLKVKELGGTGRTHDWRISKLICDSVDVPILLAGGINPKNVKEAINAVNPFGIDLCSGVRVDGKLNEQLLSELFRELNY
ncbi:MAG: phosphoribosylanthranilate isomerase [Ignavibacterium sp.]|nr:MAG: phosphoribosylanthranilate isomerase [Ignavibacterium sp.]